MMQAVKYVKGDLIVTEGHRGSEAFVVEHGRVEVFRAGPPELPLAVLGPGDIFGEMALITEQPRSASVRALEDVEADVIAHDEFLAIWRAEPDALLPLVRVLCERLRSLTALVAELAQRATNSGEVLRAHLGSGGDVSQAPVHARGAKAGIVIEGLTPLAQESLGGRPLSVDRFPYRIGRQADAQNPLSHNDLVIPDREPFHVSRNHCMVGWLEDRCFLVDRGSRLGTVVNGTRIGGEQRVGRIELGDGDNEVWLGGPTTPYRFRITVARA